EMVPVVPVVELGIVAFAGIGHHEEREPWHHLLRRSAGPVIKTIACFPWRRAQYAAWWGSDASGSASSTLSKILANPAASPFDNRRHRDHWKRPGLQHG